jgi:predicted small lipoprotein YifL
MGPESREYFVAFTAHIACWDATCAGREVSLIQLLRESRYAISVISIKICFQGDQLMRMRVFCALAVVAAAITCGCGEKGTMEAPPPPAVQGVDESGVYGGAGGEASEHTGGGGSPGGGSPGGPGGGSPGGPG